MLILTLVFPTPNAARAIKSITENKFKDWHLWDPKDPPRTTEAKGQTYVRFELEPRVRGEICGLDSNILAMLSVILDDQRGMLCSFELRDTARNPLIMPPMQD